MDHKTGSDGSLQVHRRQRWENELRADQEQSRAPVATFGEKVWYKQIREQKERKDKIESEWHEGQRLGQSRSTNETIDLDERWKGDFIKKLQGPQRGQTNREHLCF